MSEQRDREWLAEATESQIEGAYNAGELQWALGLPANTPVVRTEAWLKAATPEQINEAHKRGELDELLGARNN